MSAAETTGTVIVALVANLVIALAKIGAGLLSGSSAMLAEGAHSVADTTNQVFLLASLRRSRRPADETHPFGYGKERFFWSLLAAVGIFVSGGAFSVYQGVHSLLSQHGGGEGHFGLSYLVLGVAFVAETVSWLRAVQQVRREARAAERSVIAHVRLSSDPTVKTVLSEDSAALAGILLAAAGIGLHQITGSAVWDAVAAIAVGLLLGYVAFVLGRDTKELLIGEAAEPKVRQALGAAMAAYPEVDEVVEVLTMHLGPEELLVAARLDTVDTLDATEVEVAIARIEADLRERFPIIAELFLHMSSRDREGRAGMAAEREADRAEEPGRRHGGPAPPDQVGASAPVDSKASSAAPTNTR
jgi:cation diffusion facilitator family transporter